jgi:Na+/melibiose symporter-like transporter
VFLVGVLPALLVLWIRRAVPEPEVWQGAKQHAAHAEPRFMELFRGPVRRISILTLLVCGLSLSAHWAFMFWYPQHLRGLPELKDWTDAARSQLVGRTMMWMMAASIAGNFLSAWIARWIGYRRAISLLCVVYCAALLATYGVPRGPDELWYGYLAAGMSSGFFALFTMYMPPLFPVLLRTTGAGFCYNFGRIAAGLGTVFFGLVAPVGDVRIALIYAGLLFLPAAAVAWLLPEPPEETGREATQLMPIDG